MAQKKKPLAVVSKVTGRPVDPKRSRAARKAAETRKANALKAMSARSLRLHHKLVAGGAIAAVLVFTFIGIRGQLQTYAASTATGTFVGIGGKCLDNSGSRLSDHNRIQLYKCNGTNAQKWVYTSTGSLKANAGSDYCLDVPGNSKAEYTYLQLYKCNETSAQHFSLKNNSIIGATTGFCATDHYGSTANNTQVWMKGCHASTAQKWVYSGAAVATTSPSVVAPPSSGSGGSTVPVTTANYDFNSTINGLKSSTNLALNAGMYTVNDFSYNNAAGAYSKYVTGISGKGVGQTIVEMKPGSSTKAKSVPTTTGMTNQFYLLRTDGKANLSNFTLQGTSQGQLYNGMILYGSNGGTISNVKVAAIPGNNHYPPGETFSINDFHGVNNTYNNVEVDGAGVGASGFGLNSSSGGTWNNSYSHDNKYSIGWAFWQHTNGATINNSKTMNNYGGVNFERATGTYYLNNMTFGGNQVSDISGGQDQDGSFKVIIKDPILVGESKLRVNWFSTEGGVKDKYGKANIQVIVGGVDKTSSMIQWIGVGAG